MKIIAGDWETYVPINLKFGWKKSVFVFKTGFFKKDVIPTTELIKCDLITEDNKHSILGKIGWGGVGLFALGGLGLLAGVIAGGNRRERVMVLSFEDGRTVMVKGKHKEYETMVAIAFKNQTNLKKL